VADGADGGAPPGGPPSGPGDAAPDPPDPPDPPGRLVARPGRPTLGVIEGALPVPVTRTRILQDTVTEHSPENPDLEFVLRRMGNRERIKRQDLFAKLRYVQVDGAGTVTERDLPMGQVALEDIVMGLVGWNIEDPPGKQVPITKETIQDYLSPEEFDFVLDKIRDLNPIVFGERTNGKDGANGTDGTSTNGKAGEEESGSDPPVGA
jgi:hypothetical protein